MKPLDMTLRSVQVQVGLPPDAELVEVLETPGRTELRDGPPGILIWSGAEFASGQQIDAFSFSLAKAPEGEFRVNVFWSGDSPGQANYLGRPPVGGVGAFVGQAPIGSAGTAGTWIPVADTGVQVNVPAGATPDGTMLAVQHLTPDDDPSPSQEPDLWWGAGVDIRGLPADAIVSLLVPARRALPPGISVPLFAQRAGGWQRLAEPGQTTADGQFVSISTTGNGKVAVGISTALQAQLARPPSTGEPQVILPSGIAAPIRTPVEQSPILPSTPADEPDLE